MVGKTDHFQLQTQFVYSPRCLRNEDKLQMATFEEFQNRIAVLTGAASGIGRELLLQLVRRGTHVAACDIDRDSLQVTVRQAQAIAPDVRVTAHVHDISDEKSVVRFAKAVTKEHGSDAIHLLFANEKVRETYPLPTADVSESAAADDYRIVSLEALVRMKLNSYRDKDRTHLRDLLTLGLVDASWLPRLVPEHAARLQQLIDDPDG